MAIRSTVGSLLESAIGSERTNNLRRLERRTRNALATRIAMEPVKKLTFEDVTALGEELQKLDLDMTGRVLDDGARADYQRALDAYEVIDAGLFDQPDTVLDQGA